MIKLKKLSLKAFRSFVDETVINFNNNGFYLINGVNKSNNDASGTGKSSIFYAIAYVLDILPSGMTAKDLQCFLTKEKMNVILTLEDKYGQAIVISKGKENWIEYNSKKYEGASLVSQHIDSIFGMNKDLRSLLIFRPQRSGGLILSKNSTELVEFLSKILQLEKIEFAIEESEKNIKTLEKTIELKQTESTTKTASLEQLKQLDDFNINNKNVMADILKLREQKKTEEVACSKALKECEEKTAQLLSQAKSCLEDSVKKDSLLKKESDLVDASAHQKLVEIGARLTDLRSSKKLLEQKKLHLQKMEQSICPTCNQHWSSVSDIEKVKTEILDLIEKTKDLDKLEEENRLLSVSYANRRRWEPDPLIGQLSAAIKTIEQQFQLDSVKIKSELSKKLFEIQKDIDTKEGLVKKSNEIKVFRQKVEEEIQTINNEISLLQKNLSTERDFIKVLGKDGFLGLIFDEILQQISYEVNNSLKSVANMMNVTFGFDTEKLTTKGTVARKITPYVNILGNKTKLDALSGGMLSSLEIITDLSVKTVIESRTSNPIGFAFYDEAFDGQGRPSKEAILDILKSYTENTDRSLFVIDHNSEVQELFDNVITVEMQNGVSSVK